jgi:acetoin utilization deacetylase AcuC-like enzyme
VSVVVKAQNRLRRWLRPGSVAVWYSPLYRLPLPSVELVGIDVRRADRALGYLLQTAVISQRHVRVPERIRYQDLARVHGPELLDSLHDPEVLASVFAVDASEVVVDELLGTVRTACGGTLAAARHTLGTHEPCLNLAGGFHHAGPNRAAAFCPLNDIAVAVAALRSEGFSGQVSVLDLDAHPPDGVVECLGADARVWTGSLSGCNWGPLERADETVLPPGTGDAAYLDALRSLLARMPKTDLAFVLAGGDVLAGDRCGGLALSLEGVRSRDLLVASKLEGLPSVWLPAGGYHPHTWRVLAGTVVAVALRSAAPVPAEFDSLRTHYAWIAKKLSRETLEGGELSEFDLYADLGGAPARAPRFLGYYTAEGLEHALFRYGILGYLRRLGYTDFRVVVDRETRGDRLRLLAKELGAASVRPPTRNFASEWIAPTPREPQDEHVLLECVLQKQSVLGQEMLYVHWLTLRNPRARFSTTRPRLPGQEVPGLGLAKESGELLGRAAERLGLTGIAYRPAWYHTAYAGLRMGMRFAEGARQGRFEAMIRDLSHLPMRELTLAVAEKRVLMNGTPYVWEADIMVYRTSGRPFDDDAEVHASRSRAQFSLLAESQSNGPPDPSGPAPGA